MADISSFTVEGKLVAMVQYHERKNTNKTAKQSKKTLRNVWASTVKIKSSSLEKKKRHFRVEVFLIPSAVDGQNSWSGTANIHAIIFRFPKSNCKKHSAELGVSYALLHHAVKEDLHIKPYKPTVICELSNVDHENRLTACERLLQHFNTIPKGSKGMFSDECAVYLIS